MAQDQGDRGQEHQQSGPVPDAQREIIVTEHSERVTPGPAPGQDESSPSNREPGQGDETSPRDGDQEKEKEKEKETQSSEGSRSINMYTLLISAALALIFGGLGAVAYNAFFGGPAAQESNTAQTKKSERASGQGRSEPANQAKPAASTGQGGTDARQSEPVSHSGEGPFSGRSDSEMPADRIDELAQQIEGLRQQIESMPSASSPSVPKAVQSDLSELTDDLSQLQEMTGTIESISQSVNSLSQQVKQHGERLDSISDLLDTMESDLTTIKDRMGASAGGILSRPSFRSGPSSGETGTTGEDTAPERGPASLRRLLTPQPDGDGGGNEANAQSALEQGIQQFKNEEFQKARDTFFELLEQKPSDARVWYFAALANGKATGQWKGQTERLVLQGVERERAGTPPSVAIDAAVADLTERLGKQWLAFYRQRVSRTE